jgi:hypothetical protein
MAAARPKEQDHFYKKQCVNAFSCVGMPIANTGAVLRRLEWRWSPDAEQD